PFLLEGIGSLAKIRSGEYSFAGASAVSKLKDSFSKETVATSATEESFSSVEQSMSKRAIKLDWKKPALAGLALLGTALAIWGGYTVYKKAASKNQIASISTPEPLAAAYIPDTSTIVKPDNNIITKPSAPAIPAGNYKFVLETAGKTRAFDRYARLKNYQWNVQMETNDSVKYKLYLLFPTADTTKVLDSLTALNGRRVYIENNQP
ncbi:MAG TPA: hypothetical protein VF476_05205, partial [Chitinophagaceae bacterium]